MVHRSFEAVSKTASLRRFRPSEPAHWNEKLHPSTTCCATLVAWSAACPTFEHPSFFCTFKTLVDYPTCNWRHTIITGPHCCSCRLHTEQNNIAETSWVLRFSACYWTATFSDKCLIVHVQTVVILLRTTILIYKII